MLENFERKSHIELGNLYFWTATINGWKHLLKNDDFKQIILESLKFLSYKEKIDVFGFVIMPNHIHIIWRINSLNGKESPHASFLKFTAHEFKKRLRLNDENFLKQFSVNAGNKQFEFWQRDSLAVKLYNKDIAYQKLDYIHNNPVSNGWQLSKEPMAYKFSSSLFYKKEILNYCFLKDLRNEF